MEKDIQNSILKYLRKTYPQAIVWKLSERTNCGIPDVLFIHNGHVMFFELKRQGGVKSPLQKKFVNDLLFNKVYAGFITSVGELKEAIEKEFLDKNINQV